MSNQIRVVLAESHPVIRAGMRYFLDQCAQITVVGETGDGLETSNIVIQQDTDVLLLDMHLPNRSGFEIAHYLYHHLPSIRILAVCIYDDSMYLSQILGHHVHGCILKEDIAGGLVEAIITLAQNNHGWFSHKIADRLLSHENRHSVGISFHGLSNRETEVLHLIGMGYDNQRIANTLSLSLGTVKNHITNIYQKLQVKTRAKAVTWVWEHGLLNDHQLPTPTNQEYLTGAK